MDVLKTDDQHITSAMDSNNSKYFLVTIVQYDSTELFIIKMNWNIGLQD